MRVRRTLTTAGLGLGLILSGAGVAQAADYRAKPRPVSSKVSTPAGNAELKVNIGPT